MPPQKSRYQSRGKTRVAASVLTPPRSPSLRASTIKELLQDQFRALLAGRTAEERSDAAGALLGETFGTPASITSGIRDVAEAVRTGQPISEGGALRMTRPVPLSEADNMARAGQVYATRPGSLAAMRQAAGDLLEMGGGFAPTTPSDVLFPLVGKLAAGAKAVAAGAKGTSLAALPFAIGSQGWKEARAAIQARRPLEATVGAVPGMPGFYSRVERAVLELPEKGVPAEKLLDKLRNSREGVSSDELALRNIPAFLEARAGTVITPAELQAHLDAHPLALQRYRSPGDAPGTRAQTVRIGGIPDPTDVTGQNPAHQFQDVYRDYSLGRVENEALPLHLVEQAAEDYDYGGTSIIGTPPAATSPTARPYYGHYTGELPGGRDQPLLHMRQSVSWPEPEEFTPQIRREAMIENVQSDWLQDGRKYGFYDPAKANAASNDLQTAQQDIDFTSDQLAQRAASLEDYLEQNTISQITEEVLRDYALDRGISLNAAIQELLQQPVATTGGAPPQLVTPRLFSQRTLLQSADEKSSDQLRELMWAKTEFPSARADVFGPYQQMLAPAMAQEGASYRKQFNQARDAIRKDLEEAAALSDADVRQMEVERLETILAELDQIERSTRTSPFVSPTTEFARQLQTARWPRFSFKDYHGQTLLQQPPSLRPNFAGSGSYLAHLDTQPSLISAVTEGENYLRRLQRQGAAPFEAAIPSADLPWQTFETDRRLDQLRNRRKEAILNFDRDIDASLSPLIERRRNLQDETDTAINAVPQTGYEDAWPAIGVKEAILQAAYTPNVRQIGVTPADILRGRGELIGDKFQNERIPDLIRKTLRTFGPVTETTEELPALVDFPLLQRVFNAIPDKKRAQELTVDFLRKYGKQIDPTLPRKQLIHVPYPRFELPLETKQRIRRQGLPILAVLGAANLGGWRTPLFSSED